MAILIYGHSEDKRTREIRGKYSESTLTTNGSFLIRYILTSLQLKSILSHNPKFNGYNQYESADDRVKIVKCSLLFSEDLKHFSSDILA